jgi:hypothetical protein
MKISLFSCLVSFSLPAFATFTTALSVDESTGDPHLTDRVNRYGPIDGPVSASSQGSPILTSDKSVLLITSEEHSGDQSTRSVGALRRTFGKTQTRSQDVSNGFIDKIKTHSDEQRENDMNRGKDLKDDEGSIKYHDAASKSVGTNVQDLDTKAIADMAAYVRQNEMADTKKAHVHVQVSAVKYRNRRRPSPKSMSTTVLVYPCGVQLLLSMYRYLLPLSRLRSIDRLQASSSLCFSLLLLIIWCYQHSSFLTLLFLLLSLVCCCNR